jgi:iron complex transport system substrate-binding protein
MGMHMKFFFLRFLYGILCGAFFACGPQAERQEENQSYRKVTDDLGRELTIPARPRRVMALAPSMTEMLFAICPDSSIIARTQNCNYPAQALAKPVVNNYPIDLEKLVSLQPDLIFTTDGITPLEQAEQIGKLGIPVYYQRYSIVADVFQGMTDIGNLLHCQERAQQLTDSLRAEINRLTRDQVPADSPRVLVVTWHDPIYAYGQNTLMTDKLRLAGARNAVAEVFSQPYPALTREYVLQLNPDMILGGDLQKMESSFFQLYPELRQTTAYRQKKIFATSDDLTARPSPRIVESIRELKNLIH